MSSRGRPENFLGTSRIKLPGTSLERPIKTSTGCHFKTSARRQIGMSPGRHIGRPQNGQIGSLGDVGGGHSWDVLGTNICRLGNH